MTSIPRSDALAVSALNSPWRSAWSVFRVAIWSAVRPADTLPLRYLPATLKSTEQQPISGFSRAAFGLPREARYRVSDVKVWPFQPAFDRHDFFYRLNGRPIGPETT